MATCARHGGEWGDDETCEHCTFEDGTPRPAPEPVQMSYKEALDMAIFAINTLMYPDASSVGDVNALEVLADDIIATLVDMRETVQGGA